MAELSQQHQKNKYQQKLRQIFTCTFAKTTSNFETEEYVLFGQSAD